MLRLPLSIVLKGYETLRIIRVIELYENYASQSMLWWSVDVRKYDTYYTFRFVRLKNERRFTH